MEDYKDVYCGNCSTEEACITVDVGWNIVLLGQILFQSQQECY